MKAMIFAAGLGTRLRPLTETRPKALVEIQGVSLLELAIRYLMAYGVREIVVNVHHHAAQIVEFIREKNSFGINIAISDETNLLLDTGGGLKKARDFFNSHEPFFVINTDILTDLNLCYFYDHHVHAKSLATLAVRNRESSRYLLFDENHQLAGWRNQKTGEEILVLDDLAKPLSQLAFSGVHVVSPQIFDLMNETGKFSIIDAYLRLAKQAKIIGFLHDQSIWMDVGKVPELERAATMLNSLRWFSSNP
ncbi:Nucleotidyl transferase [Chloroherpeton thalassium ATCC 35110]|uniref:Nucleotidyl transferase n=1 Tax=Chloroherpeton thalassium (strain ATCC 35110 / GB-78) TaxID=517418 RepID=B3QWY3_CHLT3|nr:nucleotidyltransferase family protein [Chloroherpeton thalassium]ACF13347.1 Nucleotidyl transferase [Chloroherpeton thalassium ATCC 35110]